MLPPHPDNGSDVPLWPGDRMGEFSISSAYQMLQGIFGQDCIAQWKHIWNLEVPERIRCFAWQISHGRLVTNDWKFRRGLGDPYCHYCSSAVGSVLHVLRDCPLASQVWSHLVKYDQRSSFFLCDLSQWVSFNLSVNIGRFSDLVWASVWITTCYKLWFWRNKQWMDCSKY